ENTKHLTDSLYYALAVYENESGLMNPIEESDSIAKIETEKWEYSEVERRKVVKRTKAERINSSKSKETIRKICHINPTSIMAVKTDNFSQTFLATKEFEQRLKVLHKIQNAQSLFDLYVNNTDKNLWEVDEMVVQKLSGNNRKLFENFANQKLSNVNNGGIYQKQLSEYYNSKLIEVNKTLNESKQAYLNKTKAELEVLETDLKNIRNE